MLVPLQVAQPFTIYLNLTHEDESWRKVMRDRRFRHALSFAINRREVIENFYLGEFAELPIETGPSTYDQAEANRLLDEMGLDQKDSQGFRLTPDRRRVEIPFEILTNQTEDHIPVAELVAEHWKTVGLLTTVKAISGGDFGQRFATNQLKATTLWEHLPTWGPGVGFVDYLPSSGWGPLWQKWLDTEGRDGEEPPDEVKELYESHGTLLSSRPGSPESIAALEAIKKSHYDNLWAINVVENPIILHFGQSA